MHTVAEDIFMFSVGPQRSVNLFSCALEMLLFTCVPRWPFFAIFEM